MKKLIVFALLPILAACTQKPADDGSPLAETKALYERNLAVVKTVVSSFENENIDALAATLSDTAVWVTSAYGSVPGTKSEWTKALASYMADWDSLRLKDPVFLPGLNSKTYELDGSVRYYGQWVGVHKSGIRTALNFYGTYEFNKDNKIVSGAEFYDLGGLMNAVRPK